ncbi:MAG TPA: acyltransferase [Ignavibacteriales bacterium]|nr:acyltransferase [Ignavibacteriales bacterium]
MEKIKTYGKHNNGIDTLRGLSVLSVILLHLNIRIPFKTTLLGSIMPKPVYNILFFSGYYGVCIFFVISGFLITHSSLNKWNSLPKIRLREFYSMRFARIMPMLLALLLALSVLHIIGFSDFVINPRQTSLGRAILAALTFHINLLELKVGYLPGSWDILWSLSVEEFFYFFFPIVCFFCRKERQFILLVSAFLVLSPFARTVWYPGNELGDRNYFAYLDAIALGCIAALISRRIKIKKLSLIIISSAGWLLFILVMVFRKVVFALGLSEIGLNVTLLAIGTAIILIAMHKRYTSRHQPAYRLTAALSYLGRSSYEIYLTHMFIVLFFVQLYNMMKLSGEWAWALYVSAIIVSGIFGSVIAEYFSNPFNLYLRKRFNRLFKKEDSLYNVVTLQDQSE